MRPMLTAKCPGCSRPLLLREEILGVAVRCPNCSRVLAPTVRADPPPLASTAQPAVCQQIMSPADGAASLREASNGIGGPARPANGPRVGPYSFARKAALF